MKKAIKVGDYLLTKVTGTIKTKEIKGIIIRIKYLRVMYNNPWLQILHTLFLYREYKETIYWNPDKQIISVTDKYGNIGPKSRGRHSMVWFEVDRKNAIYRNFTDTFIHDYRLPIPFPGIHLEKVTSKRLKTILDEIIFTNKNS